VQALPHLAQPALLDVQRLLDVGARDPGRPRPTSRLTCGDALRPALYILLCESDQPPAVTAAERPSESYRG